MDLFSGVRGRFLVLMLAPAQRAAGAHHCLKISTRHSVYGPPELFHLIDELRHKIRYLDDRLPVLLFRRHRVFTIGWGASPLKTNHIIKIIRGARVVVHPVGVSLMMRSRACERRMMISLSSSSIRACSCSTSRAKLFRNSFDDGR